MNGMSRKFVIAVVIILGVAAVAWWFLRPASPSGEANISHQGLDVSVSYSRPYKKGRVIFGDATTGALQPDGQYWRMGANKATEITFNKDVLFGGKAVKAGTYRMYAVPGPTWQVTLNSALGKSGSELPDKSLDVITVDVTPTNLDEPVEQMTLALVPSSGGVVLEIRWDRTGVNVDIS